MLITDPDRPCDFLQAVRQTRYKTNSQLLEPLLTSRIYIYNQSWGLIKWKCEQNCTNPACIGAHPNKFGSNVTDPLLCKFGSISSCKRPHCIYNHFTTDCDFFDWRAQSPISGRRMGQKIRQHRRICERCTEKL